MTAKMTTVSHRISIGNWKKSPNGIYDQFEGYGHDLAGINSLYLVMINNMISNDVIIRHWTNYVSRRWYIARIYDIESIS